MKSGKKNTNLKGGDSNKGSKLMQQNSYNEISPERVDFTSFQRPGGVFSADYLSQNKFLIGKVNKLSNKGWSYHFRLLKMDQLSISYYKQLPKDYDEESLRCSSVESGKIKPKQTVPLRRILQVDEIQEDDKKKFKKLAKAHDIAFKVVFPKNYLLKKEYIPGEDDDNDDDEEDQDDQDDQQEARGRSQGKSKSKQQPRSKSKSKPAKKALNLTTWYFVCENKYQQQLWIECLITQALQQNPKFIVDDGLLDKVKINSAERQQMSNPRNNNTNNFNAMQEQSDEDEEDNETEEFNQSKNAKNQQQVKQVQKSGQIQQQKAVPPSKNVQQSSTKQQSLQQVDLFGNGNKKTNQKTQNKKSDQQSHQQNQSAGFNNNTHLQESEFNDLNQVLMQNLNINNVNIDGDGNINDMNNLNAQKMQNGDDDEDDQYYQDNQDAKERLNKLKDQVSKYWKQSIDLQNKKTKKEQKGWDLKFQNYWGYLISADKNLKDSMTLSERFFDHVGKFRRTSQQLVKEIIDELHIPSNLNHNKQKHIPVQKLNEEHLIFLDDDDQVISQFSQQQGTLLYFEKNILIKITHQGEQMVDTNSYQNQTNAGNRTNAMFNNGMTNQSNLDQSAMGGTHNHNSNKNQDPFQNLKWKLYGREFLSMDVMFDSLFLLSKPEATHKLRVPLSALVDYKGFRAIAVASIPIQPQLGPSIGFYTDGKYVPHDHKLKQELAYVGDVLNLKENRISQKGQTQFESVPVSFFIKIYNYQQPESKTKGKDPDTPTKKSSEYHFSELQYLEEPFYVLKTSEIFPYDVDLNEVYPRKDKYLRPEFVCVYERPLKADARKDLGFQVAKDTKSKDDDVIIYIQPNLQNDQVELIEASRYLKNTIIPSLVNLLDSLIIMPVDSESLEQTFHTQGVNMRYLGLVCSSSVVPHVRDICISEMIARTCKNILNKQIAAMILDHQRRFTENASALENLKRSWNNKNFMSNSSLPGLGKRGNMSSMQAQQQEFEAKEKELLEEQADLNRNMDDSIKMCIVDFINLVFGAGKETSDFWDNVLLPYTAQYYSYPMEELFKQPSKNLNAIFFALIYHAGIKILRQSQQAQAQQNQGRGGFQNQINNNDKYGQINVTQKDDDYFKEFGKTEQPFGPPEKSYVKIELQPKSKTFSLRNLPYKLLSDTYRDFKSSHQLENALKCCKMRRLMKRSLEEKEDMSTIADICEIAIEKGEEKIAKEQAIEALKNVHPMHAESIKFYCILLRAFFNMDFYQESDHYFSRALATLEHHWGPYHPLHTTIYGIMAYLLISKGRLEEAGLLYHSSVICCMRVLGPNHIQTAEVRMDYGRLYLKMKNKDQALEHFQEAFLIYESYFGLQSLSTAQAALQIANILEEQGKLQDAYRYSEIASETFVHPTIFGEVNDKTISSLWLKLSISYALKRTDTLNQCRKIYDCILKRDISINNNQSIINDGASKNDKESSVDLVNQKIQKIKEFCIATTILEMTRTLKREDRLILKAFCDKVLFRAHQQDEEGIPDLADLQHKIDPAKIMSVSNLKFDESGKNFLETLYQGSKEYEGGFAAFYQKTIDAVMSQASEAKKQSNLQASTSVKPSRGVEQNILQDFFTFNESPEDFFKKTIKAFEHYNFYNALLH